MNEAQKYPRKWKGFLLLALALVVIGGIGFFAWTKVQAGVITFGQATPTPGSAYKTTTVRRSDLSVAISGSGTVITAQSVDLGFSVDGTLSELNVQVGDQVTQGQVLARLGDTSDLQQAILDDQLAVQVAQKALNDLQTGGAGALAEAQASQAKAESDLATAQAYLKSKQTPMCEPGQVQDFYQKYLDLQKEVKRWESYQNGKSGYGESYILEHLNPLRKQMDAAYANWQYCTSGPSDQSINESQAALKLAEAKLEQAKSVYQTLQQNNGVDPVQLSIAQATLENAKLQLSKDQTTLAGTTITAPMNGTVTAVNAKVDDAVSAGTLITLANLEQPQVQVNIDETDLENFAKGCVANVTFDSLPGESFPGVVSQVSPVLVTVNNSNMVQGLVELQKKQMASGKPLSVGLTASVEVTCKQAKNALVVPAQALYEPNGQPAYVYILNAQGEPEKREVAVGIRTLASAEITSGLSEGEKVVTSQVGKQ